MKKMLSRLFGAVVVAGVWFPCVGFFLLRFLRLGVFSCH